MNEKSEKFQYNYSASQQEELKNIRKKYAAPTQEEDKMARLRQLDASVTKPGTIVALLVGLASTLVFGIGMCCCMVWMEKLFIPGIVIGVIGLLGVASAYPLYTHITKKQREKLGSEILRLADELMK